MVKHFAYLSAIFFGLVAVFALAEGETIVAAVEIGCAFAQVYCAGMIK